MSITKPEMKNIQEWKKVMVHFQIWKRISFISHCGVFIVYCTQHDFPNLHILPLVVLSF